MYLCSAYGLKLFVLCRYVTVRLQIVCVGEVHIGTLHTPTCVIIREPHTHAHTDVYRGEVALKVSLPDKQLCVSREARALNTQAHNPAVLPVMGRLCEADSDRCALLTPVCVGGCLRQYLSDVCTREDGNRVLMSAEGMGSIIVQLVVCVHMLHLPGLAHLDLKCENVLVDADSEGELKLVKLCDFGISQATQYSNGKLMMRSCGFTAGYAAPELLEAKCAGWRWSVDGVGLDTYGIGKVLHMMLFGRNVYDSVCAAQAIPGTHMGLLKLMKQLTHTDHTKRPPLLHTLTHSCLCELVVPVLKQLFEDKMVRDVCVDYDSLTRSHTRKLPSLLPDETSLGVTHGTRSESCDACMRVSDDVCLCVCNDQLSDQPVEVQLPATHTHADTHTHTHKPDKSLATQQPPECGEGNKVECGSTCVCGYTCVCGFLCLSVCAC